MSGVGAVGLYRNRSNAYAMFSSVPLLFAAQQAGEGVVWLTTPDSAHPTVHRMAVISFLACALVVWPIWLSFSLECVERDPTRRRVLRILGAVGVVVAASASVLLARQTPVAVVVGHSIRYDRAGIGGGPLEALALLAYALPTIVPFFVSTMRLARAIGAALIVSLITAALIERDALTSVWCFFAALLSVLVVIAIAGDKRNTSPVTIEAATTFTA
jgi:hypothetical protein